MIYISIRMAQNVLCDFVIMATLIHLAYPLSVSKIFNRLYQNNARVDGERLNNKKTM